MNLLLLTCVLTSINPSFQTGDTTPLKKTSTQSLLHNTFGTSSSTCKALMIPPFACCATLHPYRASLDSINLCPTRI
jgi:hypothetical protein